MWLKPLNQATKKAGGQAATSPFLRCTAPATTRSSVKLHPEVVAEINLEVVSH